ncbi:hypothetical protein ACH4PR_55545, partial [Streptomyces mirabilis]
LRAKSTPSTRNCESPREINGQKPVRKTRGPSSSEGFVLSNGQHDEYPNEDTVPLEEAFRILSHILSEGSWPPDTSWMVDR